MHKNAALNKHKQSKLHRQTHKLNPILAPNNTMQGTISLNDIEKIQREYANAKSILLQLHYIKSSLQATLASQEQTAVVIILSGCTL